MNIKVKIIAAIGFTLIAANANSESIVADGYQLQQLVPPSPFCGVHGLGVDANDQLYAGSVVGQRLYSVDKNSGAVTEHVGPPKGMADDMEFLPDGTLVWTSISQNAVRAKKTNGDVVDLATNLASVNSIAYRESDNKLFVAQVFGGDGLWEIDTAGEKPARNIIKDMGGLNGFDIGPDGMIYGPLWFKQQVVKINPDNGKLSVVADGFHTPAAANFDSNWNLYVLDTATGEIINVDINSGEKTVFAQLKTSLDNLAIDSNDVLYVSNMADNSIQAIDIKTKAIRHVVEAGLSCPTSLSVTRTAEGDAIYIADIFALRQIDGASGEVTDIARSHAANTPIAYATNVFAGKNHFYVMSSGRLQQYQRDNNQFLGNLGHIRGAQYLVELNNGDLLTLSRRGQELARYSGENLQEKTIISEAIGGATSMTLLNNNVIVAVLSASNKLVKVDLTSGETSDVGHSFNHPIDVAVLSPSQWLIRESQGKIIQINPNNNDRLTIIENFPSGRLNPAEGNRSHSMGLGRNGVIYLLSDVDNAIYTLTPDE